MRRCWRTIFVVTLVTVFMFALAGLAGVDAKRPSVFRTPLSAEPPTLDPALATDLTSLEVINQLFDGLAQFDDDGVAIPALAKDWDVSADGKTYTFHLRDAKFHNGRKVTAADFAYSWNRALDPALKSPTAEMYLGDIVGAADVMAGKAKTASGIKVIDEKTLQVTLDGPKAYFISKLTYPVTFVVPKEAVEKGGSRWTETNLVGTGPFKLKSWVHNYKVTLTAFKDYYQGAPKVETIEMPIVQDESTTVAMYESGELDYIGVPNKYVQDFKKKYPKEVYKVPSANVYYIALNAKVFPPLQDKRVRQALNLAINRDVLCDVILEGTAVPALSLLPPGMPGYSKDLEGLTFNPKRAKELLAEAGYPDPKKFPALTINYRSGRQASKQIAEFVQAQLQQNLGIPVVLQPLEWGKLLEERNNHRLGAWFISWFADYLDPQNFLSLLLQPPNYLDYDNPEITKITMQADVEPNQKKRIELYKKANQLAALDAPWIFLYHQISYNALKPYVKGIVETPLGHLPYRNVTITD